MEPELGNDAVYGPFADVKVTLPEFLSDDIRGGLRIQEAMADDLANEFLSATVVGLGTSLGADQSLAALFKKERAELEVALAAESEFGGNTVNAFGAAFTVDQHGKLAGDFIVVGNGQGSEIALDAFSEKLERNHGNSPGGSVTISTIKYGTLKHKMQEKDFGKNQILPMIDGV